MSCDGLLFYKAKHVLLTLIFYICLQAFYTVNCFLQLKMQLPY